MVVTRFCPSNTGALHLGSARTAIMALAYARKTGGKCVLRIENTDKQRSTQESLIDILEGLNWLGLKFDDGPSMEDAKAAKYDQKYFQSERAEIYNKHIDKLVAEDKAYVNDEGVTVFRMPKEDVAVYDTIIGLAEFPQEQIKDFPIRRADGSVLFHACVVIDDALSGVTNVIRANDHLSNTPKHIQLYRAFGFKEPIYSHMPLILDDKGAKLSKRRTDQCVLIKDFREKGYLPSAVVNMIGVMGWRSPDGKEIFDLDHLFKHFDIADCLKTNARYDAAKLLNINHQHIRAMSIGDFEKTLYQWCQSYRPDLINRLDSTKIEWDYFCSVFKDRCKILSDIINLSNFIFDEQPYDEKALNKHVNPDVLEDIKAELSNIVDWKSDQINTAIEKIASIKGVAPNKVAQAIRVAVTGNGVSPEIDKTLILLGKDKTINRVAACIAKFQEVKA